MSNLTSSDLDRLDYERENVFAGSFYQWQINANNTQNTIHIQRCSAVSY